MGGPTNVAKCSNFHQLSFNSLEQIEGSAAERSVSWGSFKHAMQHV